MHHFKNFKKKLHQFEKFVDVLHWVEDKRLLIFKEMCKKRLCHKILLDEIYNEDDRLSDTPNNFDRW